ncbi:sigma-70 family RNA polymerase sigma factor [Luteococcus peritonei]|uniref:RNA polymerase sigma factor n=1 Tax=Luteococcus peritonei TaxID=88874 RepID=A0ABW4RUR6_9ACTN
MPHRLSPSRSALDVEVTRLALLAGQGDRPALGEFIRLTQADVWRFLAHLAGAEQADDLTQDTYLRAMDALERFEGRSPARAWLLSIARRVWVDAVRHDWARPQSPRSHDWLAGHAAAGQDQTAGIVAGALLAQLSPDRREAFLLTQVMGFDYAAAAEVCQVPIGTIRSRVARARSQLVELWEPAEEAPPTVISARSR